MLDIARYGLEPIIGRYKPIIDYLASREFVYIIGNHDIALCGKSQQRKLPDSFIFSEYLITNDCLFLHGHIFDPACSGRFSWVGQTAIAVANFIGRYFPTLEDCLAGVASFFTRSGRYDRKGRTDRLATEFAKNFNFFSVNGVRYRIKDKTVESRPHMIVKGLKYMFMGHTHKATKIQFAQNAFYVNAGSWTYANSPILKLEI